MVIPEGVTFTGDIAAACRERDAVVFAVPSPYVRATARAAAPFVAEDQLIVDVAKGMEAETLMTLTEVIGEEMAKPGKAPRLVALSGPTHAEEVARDLPTTIVSASPDAQAAARVQDAFMTDRLRVYTNADIRGVEVAGALKNVIALAAGIAGGLGYGDNARAAIITRGIAEMARLGAAMGCSKRRSAASPALAIWWSPARACTAATTAAACSSARARLRTRPCAKPTAWSRAWWSRASTPSCPRP